MSPKDEDEIRKLILERRARFVAAALATTGLHACTLDSGPSVCLSIAMTPSTTGTGTVSPNDTSHATSTTTTSATYNTCHNPPACVCLSIAMTQPPVGPTMGPIATDTNGSTMSDPGASTLEVVDAGTPDASAPDGGVDAGTKATDAGPNDNVTLEQTTIDIETTSESTEPSVCLTILYRKK